jgi:hypothetical protein
VLECDLYQGMPSGMPLMLRYDYRLRKNSVLQFWVEQRFSAA